MTILAVTRRPVVLETRASASMLTTILGNIAGIAGRMADYGIDDLLPAQAAAATSIEVNPADDYYRKGFAAGTAPSIIPGWTFSRTGAGTAPTSTGSVTHFATGVPRVTDRGLLIEEARTNLALRSQEIDNGAWGPLNYGAGVAPVITANAALAPDGTMTADQVVLDIAGGTVSGDGSAITQTVTVVNGVTYVGSFWVRAVSTPFTLLFRHGGSGNYLSIAVTTAWQRIERSDVASGTSSLIEITLRGGLGSSQAGTFYIWGVQMEAGAAATSYIPTTSASVTRGADSAIITGESGLLEGPFTVVADVEFRRDAANTQGLFSLWSGSGTKERLTAYRLTTLTVLADTATPVVPYAPAYSPSSGSKTGARILKVAVSYDGTTYRAAVDGVALASGVGARTVGLNRIEVGRASGDSAGTLNDFVRRLAILPVALGTTDLQALTA